jgi:hypothetical protein
MARGASQGIVGWRASLTRFEPGTPHRRRKPIKDHSHGYFNGPRQFGILFRIRQVSSLRSIRVARNELRTTKLAHTLQVVVEAASRLSQ